MRLILCHDCGTEEVKPGEISCWTCLGERIPTSPDNYIYGYETSLFGAHADRVYRYYPIANGDSTGVTYTYTAIHTFTVSGVSVGGQDYPLTMGEVNLASGDSILINMSGKLWG